MCTCNSMELMLKVDLGRTELWPYVSRDFQVFLVCNKSLEIQKDNGMAAMLDDKTKRSVIQHGCHTIVFWISRDWFQTKNSPNENMKKFYLANVESRRKLAMSLIMKHHDFHVENPDIECSVYPKFKPCHVTLLDPIEALQHWAVNHEECHNKHLCM